MPLTKGRKRSILRGAGRSRRMGQRMRRPGMGMYHNPFAGIGFLLIIVILLLGVGYIGLIDFFAMIILSLGLVITFIGIKILRLMVIGIGILTIVISIIYLSILSGTFFG